MHLKLLIKHTFALILLMTCFTQAIADIGETYEFRIKRNELLEKIELLRSPEYDTIPSSQDLVQIEDLKQEILVLDEQIFESYEESLNRISAQRRDRSTNEYLLTWLAIGACFLAIVVSILLLMARSRVVRNGNPGLLNVYQELSSDLLHRTSPEKSPNPALLRVNLILILGLILMGVSIISYLIQSF